MVAKLDFLSQTSHPCSSPRLPAMESHLHDLPSPQTWKDPKRKLYIFLPFIYPYNTKNKRKKTFGSASQIPISF